MRRRCLIRYACAMPLRQRSSERAPLRDGKRAVCSRRDSARVCAASTARMQRACYGVKIYEYVERVTVMSDYAICVS